MVKEVKIYEKGLEEYPKGRMILGNLVMLLWLALFGEVKQDHLITSKYFGTILYTIDPGGG